MLDLTRYLANDKRPKDAGILVMIVRMMTINRRLVDIREQDRPIIAKGILNTIPKQLDTIGL